ncbi:MAG: hypothetical protein U9Q40_07640 [Campylobacterota bacterium]|nr:hypothetical protein [Campylobacterota bacterium]
MNILKYSILSSFNFGTDKEIVGEGVFFVVKFAHQITALILSTIFTAAIVLKFFYLPTFFVFKKSCNYLEESNELIITLYNSINVFVTNCNVRVYGREEYIDAKGAKSLQNINNNQPIFEKTYPFMETHLATRLRVKFEEGDTLWKWLKEKDYKDKKLDLIILVEANASKIDSSVYEVYKYSIDSKEINRTIDFYGPHSIDLDYAEYSKSKGWNDFEK